jgi:hypothetical protein
MAEKTEEEHRKVVKRVKFEDLPLKMQAEMLAPAVQKKKSVAAPKPATGIKQQVDHVQEPAMTLERAKTLMSGMNRAEKFVFLQGIVSNDNHLIRGSVIVAIGQSAMADMKPRDKREFLNFVAQDAARKKHERELRRANPAATMIPEDIVAELTDSAEDHVAATAKVIPKPKRPACRANGTKPKDKGKKHQGVVPKKVIAAKPNAADMLPKTQAVEVIVPEIVKPEIIKPEVKDDEQQQIAPKTMVPTALTSLPNMGAPLTKNTATLPVKEVVASEFEEVKIVTKSDSTTIMIGSQTFSLSRTKLTRMLDGTIKFEIDAQKVVVGNTILPSKTANEFTMTFGFETKTEVENANKKPWFGKVMLVGDIDNFTQYLRYQDRITMTDIAKYYIRGREMLVKPQYFVSCKDVPSPHVYSFRDKYTHRIMATGFFNVDWTRIKPLREDDSMFEPELPVEAKARPRGYGDADVVRFILQQDNLERCETILLFTHDEHFTSTVKYLKSIGKKVELYHTGLCWTSANLRNACDTETDITEKFPAQYPDNILDEIKRRKN